MYTGDYFYMNMGWEGQNDGWFRANSYNPNSTDPSNLNFLNDQKIITVKR